MITFAQAQAATGGTWLAPPADANAALHGGAFDTRELGQHHIFFALKGEKADGHDHLPKLAGSAIRLAVVHREASIPGFAGAVLRVDDTLAALQAMGRAQVERFRPKVVAITGSYGKTTAKEVIANVCAGERAVLRTPGSRNNEIGLPLTLLDLDGSQQVAVLEFAARHVGDIELLGRLAPPDVAVLLGVGRAHIGVFGSLEAIYTAKAEIFEHLRPHGLAVVAAADPRLAQLAQERGVARVVTFGLEAGDFHALDLSHDGMGRQTFTGVMAAEPSLRLQFHAGLPGPHGALPILAAWAVARELGISDGCVAQHAAHHPGQKGRALLFSAPGGAILVDDTYNASPETVINLVQTLDMVRRTHKILVLGHLSEQDDWEDEALTAIARQLTPGLRVLVHDPETPGTAERLAALVSSPPGGEGGGANGAITVEGIHTLPRLISMLRSLDDADTVVGIKASRSAHLERVVLGMQGQAVDCQKITCGYLINCADCQELCAK